ncbi:hypothetical protein V2I52_15510 [Brenneria sp. g21c3]|uniref:hypothetical protein n=1 Tax=Brenneria sp. g21c3 TaxID=3093893 RepID=UPI002EA7334C|nr:hypothetical protein [Brenneria sp. g21c3]
MATNHHLADPQVKIFSFYWNNIDPRLVNSQRKVFQSFGLTIEQHNRHGMDHGLWMEEILNTAKDNEIIIIVDIDCIPLNREAVQKAIDVAQSGAVFGCAQSANHIDHRYIYAGPMFFAIKAETWRALGRPSMQASDKFDVGGQLTAAALQNNVNIEMVYPSHSAVPKWLLGDKYIYGLFTIYEDGYLHLFESRNKAMIECFIEIADEISSGGTQIDYRKYILKASIESHNSYALNYFMKKSILGKLKKELLRFKKKLKK